MRRYIRKLLMSLIAIMLLALGGQRVYADLIFEPNDSFYQKNSESMKTLRREFTANGADGNVTVFSNPTSKKKDVTFENGTIFFVSFTYTSTLGTKWGIIEYPRKDNSNVTISNRETGWVKMDDLKLVYDNISFSEDHKDEFTNYNNEFDAIKDEENLLLWTYPGSGVIKRTFIINPDTYPVFDHTYTDENDRVWGYISYYMGKGGWLCFSAPSDENLPKSVVKSDELNDTLQDDNNTTNTFLNEKALFIIAITLVSVLVIITILLIRKFWSKN